MTVLHFSDWYESTLLQHKLAGGIIRARGRDHPGTPTCFFCVLTKCIDGARAVPFSGKSVADPTTYLTAFVAFLYK